MPSRSRSIALGLAQAMSIAWLVLCCGDRLCETSRAADDPASIAATIAQPIRPLRVDEGRIRAAGIRKLSTKHLTL